MNICIGIAVKQAVENAFAHGGLLSHLSKGLNAVYKYIYNPKEPVKQSAGRTVCDFQKCVT